MNTDGSPSVKYSVGIDIIPELFDEMGFKVLNVVFDRGFSLWFPWRWWKNYRAIEIFKIGKHSIQHKAILCMGRHCCFEIVWHEIFWYRFIKLQGMYHASDETLQFFIRKYLRIDEA